MRFLVDECTGPYVAEWLRAQHHNIFSVFDDARGLDDDDILQKANEDNRVLITNDKDFGEKIFREGKKHCGVIFLRLTDERAKNKIRVLKNLLKSIPDRLERNFVVATEYNVRIIEPV
ncbi:MAG: DUF5615 family PIN-like protein [Ignavibacteriales bacterium]|nr:DUF5615 family PIN-like protein [Ignavibacteriales bacterium]